MKQPPAVSHQPSAIQSPGRAGLQAGVQTGSRSWSRLQPTAQSYREGIELRPNMPTQSEIARRYANIRAAMREHNVDALVVCGNQYAGFEGAVAYTSGFEIVHRYVYVLIPMKGDPVLIFPQEARWIGDKKKPFVNDKVWTEVPGRWLRERAQDENWKRVAVYGLDYIMPVRDYRELKQGSFELVPFDFHFDMARAVKSDEELIEVRDSMDIIHEGFWALLNGFTAGKTEAEIMAPAVEVFFARGAGPRMMNIVLSGQNGEAEAHFKVPGHRKVGGDDLLLYSLEIAGAGGYWVEFSRALIAGSAKQAHPANGRRLSRGHGSCAKADARWRARLRRSQGGCRHFRPAWFFAGTSLRSLDWHYYDRASCDRREEPDRVKAQHDIFSPSSGC